MRETDVILELIKGIFKFLAAFTAAFAIVFLILFPILMLLDPWVDIISEVITKMGMSIFSILILVYMYIDADFLKDEDNKQGKRKIPLFWTVIFVINAILCFIFIWIKLWEFFVLFDLFAFAGLSKLIGYIKEKTSEKNRIYETAPIQPQESVVETCNEPIEISPKKRLAWWKYQELREENSEQDFETVHTYCAVKFEPKGKTLYYRTRNPYIKVGDAVIVPYGPNNVHTAAKVTFKKDYKGYDAPYPVWKTKFIVRKAPEWEEIFHSPFYWTE